MSENIDPFRPVISGEVVSPAVQPTERQGELVEIMEQMRLGSASFVAPFSTSAHHPFSTSQIGAITYPMQHSQSSTPVMSVPAQTFPTVQFASILPYSNCPECCQFENNILVRSELGAEASTTGSSPGSSSQFGTYLPVVVQTPGSYQYGANLSGANVLPMAIAPYEPSRAINAQHNRNNNTTLLMVTNVAYNTTDYELYMLFSTCGQMKMCTIFCDSNGVSIGMAGVRYRNVGSSLTALSMFHGYPLKGRILSIIPVRVPPGHRVANQYRNLMAIGGRNRWTTGRPVDFPQVAVPSSVGQPNLVVSSTAPMATTVMAPSISQITNSANTTNTHPTHRCTLPICPHFPKPRH